MSDMPAAILALVEAAVPSDVAVFDGRVPDGSEPDPPPERYVVLYMDAGTREADTVEHTSTSRMFRWQVTSVAPDRAMAGWLAGRVADGLVDQKPDVDEWSPGLIEHVLSHQPTADEQVLERPAVISVDRYELLAERQPDEVDS